MRTLILIDGNLPNLRLHSGQNLKSDVNSTLQLEQLFFHLESSFSKSGFVLTVYHI